jgi:predicted GIY-YIG superfamily endonuclease
MPAKAGIQVFNAAINTMTSIFSEIFLKGEWKKNWKFHLIEEQNPIKKPGCQPSLIRVNLSRKWFNLT